MADKKISELNQLGQIDGNELIPMSKGAETFKVSAETLLKDKQDKLTAKNGIEIKKVGTETQISSTPLIEDTAAKTITDKTWSAKKIDKEINDLIKDDAAKTVTDKTYSVKKTEDELAKRNYELTEGEGIKLGQVANDKQEIRADVIKDDAPLTSVVKTWSVKKIDETKQDTLTAKNGIKIEKVGTETQISSTPLIQDDAELTVLDKVWSVKKTHEEIEALIEDTTEDKEKKTWSQKHIQEKIDELIDDDAADTVEDKTYSAKKIAELVGAPLRYRGERDDLAAIEAVEDPELGDTYLAENTSRLYTYVEKPDTNPKEYEWKEIAGAGEAEADVEDSDSIHEIAKYLDFHDGFVWSGGASLSYLLNYEIDKQRTVTSRNEVGVFQKITSMFGFVKDAAELEELDIFFDTSEVTTLSDAFYGCSSLEQFDMSRWGDKKSITNTNQMFKGCTKLRYLDLSNWWPSGDSSTTLYDARAMFSGCRSLKKIRVYSVKNALIQTFLYQLNGQSGPGKGETWAKQGDYLVPQS